MRLVWLNSIFAVMAVACRMVYPLLDGYLPLSRRLVRVRDLADTSVDNATQYAVLDFIGLVEQHKGYRASEYEVITEDQYLLKVHRITASPRIKVKHGHQKPIAYLQHGITLSSDSFVLNGPGRDLAFMLADSGCDVWIGNARGNTYSKSHVNYTADSPKFWDFSYHEIAKHDLKATVDMILRKTNQTELTYYGYSMGTTLSYVFLSLYPEYNHKFRLVYSLAPVVFWNHELPRITKLTEVMYEPLQRFIKYFELNAMLPQLPATGFIGRTFCADEHPITQPICTMLLARSIGMDPNYVNKTLLPTILQHFPAGAGLRVMDHYNQNYFKGRFQAYDYGLDGNLERYASPSPPIYDLSRVTAPIVIWYGRGDEVINYEDILDLSRTLPNVVSVNAVGRKTFNHFDFLWSTDVKELVYERL